MGFFDSLRRNRNEETTVNKEKGKKASKHEEKKLQELADQEVKERQAALDSLKDSSEAQASTDASEDSDKGEKVSNPEKAGRHMPVPSAGYEEVLEGEEDEETEDVPNQADIKEPRHFSQKKPVTHVIGQTKIVSIINQKGGVGKSTTAVNLSAALGAQNKSVLLIDLDPQGNATSGLGIDKGNIETNVYDLLLGDVTAEEAIIPDVYQGLDIIPATIDLADAEVVLVNMMARETHLKTAIGGLRGKYDYIFIDCPPSLGLLTVNALVASDSLLIPIQCEFYALEGVTKLLGSMRRVKKMLNPGLEIFGVLLTMYDSRTTLSHQVAHEVREYFKKMVFDTVIPRSVKLSEAPSYGQPINVYDPKGRGAEAYDDLAKEVIRRG